MSNDIKTDAWDDSGDLQIVSLRASEDGAFIYVGVRPLGGGRGERLRLRVEEYAALPFKPHRGRELSVEELELLRTAERASAAYQRGANILGYGANSSRTLQKKLQQKGYEADVAARAVDALSLRGYLCEERDACRLARQIMRRGRGLRRILQELRARGYGDQALSAVRDELAAEDFGELCCQVAQKKCRGLTADRQARQRLLNYLVHCGFEMSDILVALRKLEEEEQN